MDIRDYLLLLTAILNVVLSFFIFLQGRKNLVNLSFAIFCFFAFLWAFSLFIFRTVTDLKIALLGMKLAYAAAAGIAASGLYFSFVFPEVKKIVFLKKILIVLPAGVIIFWLLFVPGTLVGEIVNRPWGKEVTLFFQDYLAYAVYFVSVYSTGLLILYKKQRDCRDGDVCHQLYSVFWGILIPSIFGVIFNLLLPSPWLLDFTLIWLGPSFSMIMVGAVAYAVIRHQLMNIKSVAAQVFSYFLVAVFIIELFLAKDFDELIIRIIGLGLIVLLSYFLVKSVRVEVKRREEMQRLALKLKEANEALEMLNQAKTEFISISSHQLRTPLSIVKGYLSMVLDGDYGSVKKSLAKVLGKVYRSNERLINLVNELLNISRIESGRLEFRFEPVELGKIARDIVEGFKIKAEAKRIELRFDSPKNLPKVNADAQKIKEVISNLLDNAIKYTERGWVAVKLDKKDKEMVLSVSDSGLGIELSERDKLFEKFTRGQSSQSASSHGLGIGLYICKKFVEGHGGKIWAESEGPGKGSKFSFSLPIK